MLRRNHNQNTIKVIRPRRAHRPNTPNITYLELCAIMHCDCLGTVLESLMIVCVQRATSHNGGPHLDICVSITALSKERERPYLLDCRFILKKIHILLKRSNASKLVGFIGSCGLPSSIRRPHEARTPEHDRNFLSV